MKKFLLIIVVIITCLLSSCTVTSPDRVYVVPAENTHVIIRHQYNRPYYVPYYTYPRRVHVTPPPPPRTHPYYNRHNNHKPSRPPRR